MGFSTLALDKQTWDSPSPGFPVLLCVFYFVSKGRMRERELEENPLVYFYALRVRFLLCTLRRIWPLSGGCYLPRLLLLFNGAQNAFYSPLPPPPSSNTPKPPPPWQCLSVMALMRVVGHTKLIIYIWKCALRAADSTRDSMGKSVC